MFRADQDGTQPRPEVEPIRRTDQTPQLENTAAGPRLNRANFAPGQSGDEELWFEFLRSGGYTPGQSGRGGGFYTGGNTYRNNLGTIADAFNRDTGLNARAIGDDKIDFGSGARDVITSGGDWWMSPSGDNGGSAAGAANGASGGAPVVSAPATAQSSTNSNSSGFYQNLGQNNQSLIDLLMKRANQTLEIDPRTNSTIRPQVDAFSAEQERSRRNYLNDLAESSSPYSTGSRQTAATQTAETSGFNNASFQAQLVGRELTARREEIQNALSELGTLLTADQQLALQEELGKIDASLKQQQLGLSRELGFGDLGLRQQGLNSGNDQFLANYGLQSTNQANYWDALRRGLLG